jgi:hypothetical protein
VGGEYQSSKELACQLIAYYSEPLQQSETSPANKVKGGAFLVVGGGLYQGEDKDGGHGGDDGEGDPEGAVLVRLQAPPPLVGSADDSANGYLRHSNLREVLLAVAVQDYFVAPFLHQSSKIGQRSCFDIFY